MEDCVILLGTRGSVPVSGKEFNVYGGATTSALTVLAGQSVLLDAGSGAMNLPAWALETERLPLLLTHPHADHLLGFPFCPAALRPGLRLDVYGAERGGMGVEEQIARLYAPPLWPIGPKQLPADIRFHALGGAVEFGPVLAETMEGVHPGGVTLLRLSAGGKRVVFATDNTLTEDCADALAEFARDCDLLLLDGQYSDAEWPTHATYGHSTWTAAARLAARCGAKQARVIHHAPEHADAVLDAALPELRSIHPRCAFGREGESISI